MEKKTNKSKFKSIIVGVVLVIIACFVPQSGIDVSNLGPIIESILQTTGQETGEQQVQVTVPPAQNTGTFSTEQTELDYPNIALADIPAYSGSPYVVINDNTPYFTDAQCTIFSFEYYSELDDLGRCGVTYASVGKDIMPTEDRESIGHVKPTGWQSTKYDVVEGKYLYNRCHLIGFQLTGENANKKNLITGTRSMNVDGMLPFENMVADYVSETGNHVMYRVTPLYENDNLVAAGVLMEAKSVEDNGEGVLFNVFVYNVQEGIVIDYATGESRLK